ncbi:mucin-5AC isoform X16 [Anopheles gambiae]|uniref:mucin-5AC isoform X16 n=1 Tax=Anopheles gambiae TaxID=7165 RepID=UPI002AC8E9CD|nr:mucin-5AC isoform X16 [Anopheles gambiae]XP_061506015.1 mucin-5AC isoform X16 [Anopheles gambiae]
MSKYAWVTLATNDSYSLGALVVAHSLKRVHTEHQTAVLITPGVSESMKTKLRAVFNVVEEVNLLDSKDEANLALLKRPELGVTFTKLHCWRLTQFEKCVFLDADTLVLRNCDELFEREELSAAPDIGWPDCFNSGVYVYTPNMETFSSLVQYAVTHGSFDGGDQGLLNSYFSDWAHKDIQKHLPFIYNTSSVATYSYLPAFKQFGQNTKILHFIGVAKPWLQNFNSETRKVYVPSECQHLANFLQYWWDIFAEDVHSRLSPDMSGIAGALAQLHLGEAKSKEQEAYEEHMRRQCWETGNIDYMGRDSFDNIWKRIQQTINTGSCMEESSEASVAQTTAPGTTQRASRRPSRSRSATPKRDPKDRSPTPQPEEKISVDKKEAQVVPPPVIAEEDDVAVSLSTMDCSSFAIRLQTSRLPPPIQYDPTTNTTTLTKKVFAGYQQIITTKSPEGKTRTHTKLVYDPSVEDDETKEEANVPLTTPTVASNQDVVDGTVMQKATVNTPPVSSKQKITTAAAEGGMKEMSSTKTAMQASNITPGIKKDANVSQSPMPKSASNPTAPSSAQQPQQQVAQESLAGKTNAFFETQQPVKALRKKRHISPPPQPLPTTNATSNNQASGKASTSSSPLSSSSSSATNALHRGLPANPKASVTTAILPSVVSHPSIASSSKAEASNTQNTLNTRTFLNNQKDESALTLPLLEKTSTPASQSSPSTKSSTETKPNHTAVEGSKVGSPPVPPRRKRESRTAKIAKAKKSKIYQLLLSCISCTKKKR